MTGVKFFIMAQDEQGATVVIGPLDDFASEELLSEIEIEWACWERPLRFKPSRQINCATGSATL
jgi:hypothetical protein